MSARAYTRSNGRPLFDARRSRTRPVSRYCAIRRSSCASERPVNTSRNRLTTPLSARDIRGYPNVPSTHSSSSHTDSRSSAWHSSDPPSTASARISSIVFTRRGLMSTIILQ